MTHSYRKISFHLTLKIKLKIIPFYIDSTTIHLILNQLKRSPKTINENLIWNEEKYQTDINQTVITLRVSFDKQRYGKLDQPARGGHRLVGVLFRESGGWPLGVILWATAGEGLGVGVMTHTLVDDEWFSLLWVGDVLLGSPFGTALGPTGLGGTRCSWTDANLENNRNFSKMYLIPVIPFYRFHIFHYFLKKREIIYKKIGIDQITIKQWTKNQII